jgi:hypothetical protein
LDKLRIIQISIGVVALVWAVSAFVVNSSYKTNINELQEKLQKQAYLAKLDKSWSTQEHTKQLESFEKFLGVSVGGFIKKEKEKTFFYSVLLDASNANGVMNYLLSRPIVIKSLDIRKIDEYSIELDLEVEK